MRSIAGTLSVEPEESSHMWHDNTMIAVLGASGDLAKRKIYPALFSLYSLNVLPNPCKIVGYARTKLENDEFLKRITSCIEKSDYTSQKLEEFKGLCSYISGSYNDSKAFKSLNDALEKIETQYVNKDRRNRMFYLALPSSTVVAVSQHLKEECYAKNGENRIVVEQPFGMDLTSARELLNAFKQYWSEDETYRVENYLGKEMVRNLHTLRFTNVALEPVWNKNSISNVQIMFKQPSGTEGRGGSFDKFGIIRDAIQSHLIHVLTMVAMEKPGRFSQKEIRDEKVKVLRAISPVKREDTLLAQYIAANGKPGYLDDDTVPKDSICPTYAATTLWINNSRWEGVPFILQAGKALDETKVEIRIQFKDATYGDGTTIEAGRNEFVACVLPSEAIYLEVNTLSPSVVNGSVRVPMRLKYEEQFKQYPIPEAHENLILEVLRGRQSHFLSSEEIEAAWEIFNPILQWIDGQGGTQPKPLAYPYGSHGPQEILAFLSKYYYRRPSD